MLMQLISINYADTHIIASQIYNSDSQPITDPWCSRSATVSALKAITQTQTLRLSLLLSHVLCRVGHQSGRLAYCWCYHANEPTVATYAHIHECISACMNPRIVLDCQCLGFSCPLAPVAWYTSTPRIRSSTFIVRRQTGKNKHKKKSSMNFLRNCETLQNTLKCPQHVCTSELDFKPVIW